MALEPRRAKTDWSGCCQMAVQGALWLAKRLSLNLNSNFLNRISLLLIQIATQLPSRGWVDPVPDPILPEKISRVAYSRESNPGPIGWQSDVLTTIPNRWSNTLWWICKLLCVSEGMLHWFTQYIRHSLHFNQNTISKLAVYRPYWYEVGWTLFLFISGSHLWKCVYVHSWRRVSSVEMADRLHEKLLNFLVEFYRVEGKLVPLL